MEGLRSVSEMVCRAQKITPEPGSLEGTCLICLSETEIGHKPTLPSTFLSYTRFQDVERPVLCPACWHMVKERKYRSSSWLATPDGFEVLKAPDIRKVLEDFPEPPWAMYATQTYKKHGWMDVRVNTSRETVYLTVDTTRYLVRKKEIEELTEKVKKVASFLGRWAWIKQDVRPEAESVLALEDHELYTWWKENRFRSLVLFLVSVMVPTKKELAELGLLDEPREEEEEREEEKQRGVKKNPGTLDELLGI